MLIRGSIKNSRKEANFVSRMDPTEREEYIKMTAASHEWKLLVPFIRFTKIHRYYRQIDYLIKIPDINGGINQQTGCTHNSRRSSDYLLSLSKTKRDESVKNFIAHCEANKLLAPFVSIIDHDEGFRNIEYEMDIPSKGD